MPHRPDRLARLAAERRLFTPGPRGPLSVCLVYPNTYAVGMANLGFQAVFRLLHDDPHVTVERAFLPDGPRARWPQPLRSLESDRPLGDFDVLAFSISFETDYLHVLDVLGSAGLPLRRSARGAGAPLVIAGGPAMFLNPEPLAEFVDLFLIGEAEEMLPEFLERAWRRQPARATRILERTEERRRRLPAGPLPRRATTTTATLIAVDYDGPVAGRVERRYLARLDQRETTSEILSPEAVFGDMFLVEASRGCEWGCRFCAAGFMYRPVRYRSPDGLRAEHRARPRGAAHIGLVGAEMASLPGVAALCQEIAAAGGRAVAVVAQGRSRDARACARARRQRQPLRHGRTRGRLGAHAPGDQQEPHRGARSCARPSGWSATASKRSSSTSWSGCRPRPTPTSTASSIWCTRSARASWATGDRRSGASWSRSTPSCRSRGRRSSGSRWRTWARSSASSPASGASSAPFPRCRSRPRVRARRICRRCCRAATGASPTCWSACTRDPDGWWSTLRGLRGGRHDVVDPDRFVHRPYDADELLPWDFIDHAVDKRYLLAERRKAHRGGADAAVRHAHLPQLRRVLTGTR